MSEKPAWLTEMFEGDPTVREIYDALYAVFSRDFKSGPIFYRGHEVSIYEDQAMGRELIFVHVTSRLNPETREREIDPQRCARLPWARPLIEHAGDPAVLAWDYEEWDGKINTYVWLPEHDYVVVMRKVTVDDSRRLVTAYWVEYERERRQLRQKYERRIKTEKK